MIYILHGEDLSDIRNFILKLSEDNNIGSKKEFSIEDITPAEVAESISGVDMFGASSMVVLDVTKMSRMNVKDFISVLGNVADDFLFVIFSGKGLSKANAFIKNSGALGARVMPFKSVPSSNIFKFVDTVFSGDRTKSYRELQKLLLDGKDPFYISSMLTYGLRNIAYAKFDSPAFNKLPPFIKSKVKSQAQKFSNGSVISLYNKFYNLDKGAKIGIVVPDVMVVTHIEAVFQALI